MSSWYGFGPASPTAWTPPVRNERNSAYGAGKEPNVASLAVTRPWVSRPRPAGIGWSRIASASACPMSVRTWPESPRGASGAPFR